MSFFRKLFSIFNFGMAKGFTSRPKIDPTAELPKEGLGAGGKPSDFSSSRMFATDPFSDANRMVINPATGLPMVGGIDIVGNPYGASLS